MRSQLMALMVRSRRAASAAKSSVNSTSAWRPSQATSRRSVVISKCRRFAIVLTVPCASPVGIAGRPARSSSRITCSGRSGVARSISFPTERPNRPSRTQPPTNRAGRPSASKAARTLRLDCARSQACVASGRSARAVIRPAPGIASARQRQREMAQPWWRSTPAVSGCRRALQGLARTRPPVAPPLCAGECYRATVLPGTISPSSTCGGM